VSDVSTALFFPPGSVGPVPKVVLNTVRVPLTAFGGVNLNNIRAVQFAFDERFQGAVLIADIAFASAPR
jgi:thiamine monophosphate synthase